SGLPPLFERIRHNIEWNPVKAGLAETAEEFARSRQRRPEGRRWRRLRRRSDTIANSRKSIRRRRGSAGKTTGLIRNHPHQEVPTQTNLQGSLLHRAELDDPFGSC